MALYSKEGLIVKYIKGILQETMGDDYELQLTKRCVLNKEDPLIEYIKKLEALLETKL